MVIAEHIRLACFVALDCAILHHGFQHIAADQRHRHANACHRQSPSLIVTSLLAGKAVTKVSACASA